MSKKIKVGILGGSFNPPHSGHLFISEQAIKKLHLSQLWWVVSPQNPLKETSIKNSFADRLKKCKEFTKKNPKIKISDIEYRLFKNSKKFYTYNLLKRLNAKFKDHEFYLIIGADNLENFHKWYKFDEIAKLAKVVVFDRPGYKYKAINSISAKRNIHEEFIYGKTMDISSTDIRAKKTKA